MSPCRFSASSSGSASWPYSGTVPSPRIRSSAYSSRRSWLSASPWSAGTTPWPDLQQCLYGDILTITETDIRWLIGLFFALAAFQIWGYNRLLYIGLNSVVAKAHRINVFFWQYLFAGLLALVVMFSVWAVGVLLVTALLIVPAATARNLARTAGGMFWWSILVSVTSAVAGLVLSAQEWAGTATGATVVLVSCGWFLLSAVLAAIRGEGRRQ